MWLCMIRHSLSLARCHPLDPMAAVPLLSSIAHDIFSRLLLCRLLFFLEPDYSVLLVSYVVPPVSLVSSIIRLIVASTVFSMAISLPEGSLLSRWLSFFDLMCRLSCAAHSFRPLCHFLLVVSLQTCRFCIDCGYAFIFG
jgi:hypothetical protein